jgi:hypothetical protein
MAFIEHLIFGWLTQTSVTESRIIVVHKLTTGPYSEGSRNFLKMLTQKAFKSDLLFSNYLTGFILMLYSAF